MGHRGTEGSRTPEDWQGQQYAAAPWDDDNGYSSTTYASHDDGRYQTGPHGYQTGEHDAYQAGEHDPGQGGRGPAQGYPPAPGQPNPVYPQGDFDSWNEAPADGNQGHWQDAPGQGGDWGEAGRTGEWASSQTGEWAMADAEPRHYDDGRGQWDQPAPYGQWDENGQFHQDGEGTGAHPTGAHPTGATQVAGWEHSDYPGYDDRDPAYQGQDAFGDEINDGRDPGRRGADGGGRGGRGTRGGGSRGRASRMKIILLTGAGAVVLAALGATAYTFLTGRSGHSGTAGAGVTEPRLPTPTASATSGVSKYGKWGYITSRATDTTPLTVDELYPAQFEFSGQQFQRTTDRADTNCNNALFGSQLQNAAKAYGCNQVVRASYVSSDQQMMGTIGVVNLTNSNDAAKAGDASGSTDFVTPLNGKSGPTKNISQGTGVVQAEFKGHYLILIWAEFTNLKAPSTTAQRTQLETFSSNLISGSANIALSSRMVNGKPQATASGAAG
ncbi:MAG: hypothetical protein JO016_17405 [Actinobacteria bacterium]|nr:hypothetical protein [Actinomycetota bacterium]